LSIDVSYAKSKMKREKKLEGLDWTSKRSRQQQFELENELLPTRGD
jgi:hypothetical protein